MSRRLLCNLDCETRWAGLSRVPSKRELARLDSARRLATLLLDDGDSAPGVGGPLPAPFPALGDAEPLAVLAWGETDTARSRPGGDGPRLVDRLFAAPRSAPETAAAANDKRFAFALRARRDANLEGAALLTSLDALERHAAPLPRWVAKAPFGAAGGQRLLGRSPIDAPSRARAARLLGRFGALVLEPWVERLAEAGASFRLERGEVRDLAWHHLECDATGTFRAVDLRAPPRGPAAMIEVVAADLERIGYFGPVGIDAFVHEVGGERRWHLSEINARLSFGFVARVLAERLGAPIALGIGPAADGAEPLGADAWYARAGSA